MFLYNPSVLPIKQTITPWQIHSNKAVCSYGARCLPGDESHRQNGQVAVGPNFLPSWLQLNWKGQKSTAPIKSTWGGKPGGLGGRERAGGVRRVLCSEWVRKAVDSSQISGHHQVSRLRGRLNILKESPRGPRKPPPGGWLLQMRPEGALLGLPVQKPEHSTEETAHELFSFLPDSAQSDPRIQSGKVLGPTRCGHDPDPRDLMLTQG